MRKLRILFAVVAPAIGLAALGWLFAIRPPSPFPEPRIVSIRRGESFVTVANRLAQAGVVRSPWAFIIYGKSLGHAAGVKPGDYSFPGGESLPRLMKRLVSGDSMFVVVSIPEGLTAHQIGEKLAQAGLGCQSEFGAAVLDGHVAEALGYGGLGVEGFLFPATYRFSPLVKDDQIMAAMLTRFYDVMTPKVQQRIFELGLDTRQLVTLASIIEKEAKTPAERPIIASVLYNRLAAGMPLQSDPTAQYNLAGEKERALKAVHTASAFNTYTIAGLPPGPIANPGLPSIEAALYPAHTDYLYFVARHDGTHIFSRSIEEHQRAINEIKRTVTAK